jgi:hypothetical protein
MYGMARPPKNAVPGSRPFTTSPTPVPVIATLHWEDEVRPPDWRGDGVSRQMSTVPGSSVRHRGGEGHERRRGCPRLDSARPFLSWCPSPRPPGSCSTWIA